MTLLREREIKLKYNWAIDIKEACEDISNNKLNRLSSLVDDKRKKGEVKKRQIIIITCLIVALLVLLVCLWNCFDLDIKDRASLVTIVIAMGLAIVSFLSPIRLTRIETEEVNKIIGKQVTSDIMEKIHKTVEEKSSGIEKWLVFICACGVFVTSILGFVL